MIFKLLICFLVSLILSVITGPLVIRLSKRLKFGQNILGYVDMHYKKQGTPTMGGFIFLISALISSMFFIEKSYLLAIVMLASMLGFCLLGFLDDFIKIKFKQNLGLKPYQKVIGQVGISVIVAVFAYLNNFGSCDILLPFSKISFNVGWAIIPIVIFIILACSNSVNLTDGLDGLAGGVSAVCFAGFAVLIMLFLPADNLSAIYSEKFNLAIVCIALAGALIGYLCYNCHPAKIFMGDTGSLALGGALGVVCVLTGLELYVPILGVMYVVSALSVILQVLHYKRTKKRIFLMAPLHHHFEKIGVNENRISLIYIVITLCTSILAIAINLL